MKELKTKQNTPAAASPDPVQGPILTKSSLLDAEVILKDILKISTGHLVGDFGAGGGVFSINTARLVGEQGQVYAIDVMKNTLGEIESQARMAGLSNIKTVWSNLEMVGMTKINEASLDFALVINILFQSEKHLEILTEATRLLKPNGKLLVVDWSDTKPGFAPPAERQVDPQELIGFASQLDLQLVREFKAGNYHFGLVFQKTA